MATAMARSEQEEQIRQQGMPTTADQGKICVIA